MHPGEYDAGEWTEGIGAFDTLFAHILSLTFTPYIGPTNAPQSSFTRTLEPSFDYESGAVSIGGIVDGAKLFLVEPCAGKSIELIWDQVAMRDDFDGSLFWFSNTLEETEPGDSETSVSIQVQRASVSLGSHGYLFRWSEETGERSQMTQIPVSLTVSDVTLTFGDATPTVVSSNALFAFPAMITDLRFLRSSLHFTPPKGTKRHPMSEEMMASSSSSSTSVSSLISIGVSAEGCEIANLTVTLGETCGDDAEENAAPFIESVFHFVISESDTITVNGISFYGGGDLLEGPSSSWNVSKGLFVEIMRGTDIEMDTKGLGAVDFKNILFDTFMAAQDVAMSIVVESGALGSILLSGSEFRNVNDVALIVSLTDKSTLTVSEGSFVGFDSVSNESDLSTVPFDKLPLVQVSSPIGSTVRFFGSTFQSCGPSDSPRTCLQFDIVSDSVRMDGGCAQIVMNTTSFNDKMNKRGIEVTAGSSQSPNLCVDVSLIGCAFSGFEGGTGVGDGEPLYVGVPGTLVLTKTTFKSVIGPSPAVLVDDSEFGGSIHVRVSEGCLFQDCEIGLVIGFGVGTDSSLVIEQSNFTRCGTSAVSLDMAGGESESRHTHTTQSIAITNSQFLSNGQIGQLGVGGAVDITTGTVGRYEIDISESVFDGNTATTGGAISVETAESGGSNISSISVTFSDVSGFDNSANLAIGGFFFFDCRLTTCDLSIDGSRLVGNTAKNGGGALHVVGNLAEFQFTNTRVAHSTVSSNIASGIYFQSFLNSCDIVFENNLVNNNQKNVGMDTSQVYLDVFGVMDLVFSNNKVTDSPGVGLTAVTQGHFGRCELLGSLFSSNYQMGVSLLVLDMRRQAEQHDSSGDVPHPFGDESAVPPAPLSGISVKCTQFEKSQIGIRLNAPKQSIEFNAVEFTEIYDEVIQMANPGISSISITNHSRLMGHDEIMSCLTVPTSTQSVTITDSSFEGCAVTVGATALTLTRSTFEEGCGVIVDGSASVVHMTDVSVVNGMGITFADFNSVVGTRLNVTGNSKSIGGGIVAYFLGPSGQFFSLEDSTISLNGAQKRGGGMALIGDTSAASTAISIGSSVRITDNHAYIGGGIFYNLTDYSVVAFSSHARVVSNSALAQGGGLYIDTDMDRFDPSRLAPSAAVHDNHALCGADFILPPAAITVPQSISCEQSEGGVASMQYDCALSSVLVYDVENRHMICSQTPDGFFIEIDSPTQFASLDGFKFDADDDVGSWKGSFGWNTDPRGGFKVHVNVSLYINGESLGCSRILRDRVGSVLHLKGNGQMSPWAIGAIAGAGVVMAMCGVGLLAVVAVVVVCSSLRRKRHSNVLFEDELRLFRMCTRGGGNERDPLIVNQDDDDEGVGAVLVGDLPISFKKRARNLADSFGDYDDDSSSETSDE